MGCTCSLPENHRKDAKARGRKHRYDFRTKANKKTNKGKETKATPEADNTEISERGIPSELEIEEKILDSQSDTAHAEEQKESDSKERFKKSLSGYWCPDLEKSESMDPLLLLQGVSFFKRRAAHLLGPPCQDIEFDSDEAKVTIVSIAGPTSSVVVADILESERPITPSILAISEEDQPKQSVKAYITNPPKTLDKYEFYENKCLKLVFSYVNGDRRIVYHGLDNSNLNEKIMSICYHNRSQAKEEVVKIISRKQDRQQKKGEQESSGATKEQEASNGLNDMEGENEAKLMDHDQGIPQPIETMEDNHDEEPEEEAVYSMPSYTPMKRIQIAFSSEQRALAAAAIAARLAAAKGSVNSDNFTTWLIPPSTEADDATTKHNKKHRKLPEKPMLELTEENVGLNDLTVWLNPSLKSVKPESRSHKDSASHYSRHSNVSESYLVNPFTSGDQKDATALPSSTGKSCSRILTVTWPAESLQKERVAKSAESITTQLFSIPTSSSKTSPKAENSENFVHANLSSSKKGDNVYIFRETNDEEFKKVQKSSLQLLEQFRAEPRKT